MVRGSVDRADLVEASGQATSDVCSEDAIDSGSVQTPVERREALVTSTEVKTTKGELT